MESTLDYLVRKHETLVNDYRTPDGKYREHCGLIAIEVAQRLLAEGKTPRIEKVAEEVHERGFIHSLDLVPLIFRDKWTEGWGAHQVCCTDSMAYDPLLGKAVPIKDYCSLMFGKDISMRTLIASEEIKQFINR